MEEMNYLEVPTIPIDIQKRVDENGVIYLKSNIPLESCPDRVTDSLRYWTQQTPDTVFLAQRGSDGEWLKMTYAEVWEKVQHLAQFLLECDVSEEKPIAILSGNGLEHGLLALAAMHVGIPYAPISPAYSLKSDKYEKLFHCISILTPGLIFVDDTSIFQGALEATAKHVPVLAVTNGSGSDLSFERALQTPVMDSVESRNQKVNAETIAKILFTSGSTGLPKGVINTHGNMNTNWQQITRTFPFFKDGGLKLMDWLPWNHTFGGNHNFGLTLYNGGTLYIDEGNPTPQGIAKTVKNLRDLAPTVYFNVPKGFEELIPFLKKDAELRKLFFSRLKMFFYAGASMSQHVWNGLENPALETTGKKILISSGLGMTEASPSAMFNTEIRKYFGSAGRSSPRIGGKVIARRG
ncbi:AMP-binding protein [Maribacter litopenaei]|uniref:AMP-binding protein n=1 Tax=Maribacter litopenaei TaxID=2976127 RepID=A0ABY5Y7G3_9FLAO|nr:AMP-binding protein [Maribacter litopenaei]UWX53911.1 AMP-binding protein [Maribacter litopenaei]